VLVVQGEEMAKHLGRAQALTQIGISGLVLSDDRDDDRWLFQSPLLPKLLSGELWVPAAAKIKESGVWVTSH